MTEARVMAYCPRVSAIIPLYNGERRIQACVKSVLAQDYAPLEIIVVDDGSGDSGPELARTFDAVRLICKPNGGVASARNAGVRASRGRLLAFLDQDDAWTPDKLAVQVRHLQARPDLDFVLAKQKMSMEPGGVPPKWLREGSLETEQTGFLPGTLVVWRDAFDRVGWFDEKYTFGGDDVDWFARANSAGLTYEIVPRILLHRCIHDSNLSGRVRLAHKDLLKAMHASVARHRGTSRGKRGEDGGQL